ncbi:MULTISPECIES: hypothetical protein [unclassified Microcoleus]|uniref:hypothetical protein n=1 Tax=unclassified Microcoleus TaxID=2642155 RepID=UPI002FD439D8
MLITDLQTAPVRLQNINSEILPWKCNQQMPLQDFWLEQMQQQARDAFPLIPED